MDVKNRVQNLKSSTNQIILLLFTDTKKEVDSMTFYITSNTNKFIATRRLVMTYKRHKYYLTNLL